MLRDELVKFTADRLGIGEQLVHEVLRGAPVGGRTAAQWRGAAAGATVAGAGSAASGGARERTRPVPRPVAASRARRPPRGIRPPQQSEQAYLAYCVALPEEGERRLAEVEIDDYFSSPTTRKAAEYLRGHLRPRREPAERDEDLARLVAKLTVDATASRPRRRSSSSRPCNSTCTASSATSPRPA